MQRKNPLAGAVAVEVLKVRGDATLGGHDDAHIDVRGQVEIDGALDTVVLRIKENAAVERILRVGRIEVGPEAAGASDSPYPSGGSGGAPSGGYPSTGYPPPSSGATIDEDGVVRTERWIVIGDAAKGLVLRAPDGRYYGFTVDRDGNLVQPGRFLGYRAP